MFDVLLLGLLSREVSRGSFVLRVKFVVEDKQIAADAKIKKSWPCWVIAYEVHGSSTYEDS